MISDYVKGKKKFEYPPGILRGIILHRLIDTFTDEHPATKKAKEVFRPHYRLYSGAFIDVVYDHFLATDKNEFSGQALYDFSQQVYSILNKYKQWLPGPFAVMFPYMNDQNWLYHYRTLSGTGKSFGGLVRRAAYLEESSTAVRLFEANYQLLLQCYRQFWADVKPFAQKELEKLKTAGENT
ncbi:MAG: acyl carrier protein phosphodiesterase [Chitinophagaceae bacterium]|nr:acyl carrier protein phosphodiesterase [Chitinophagaceae bacterium]